MLSLIPEIDRGSLGSRFIFQLHCREIHTVHSIRGAFLISTCLRIYNGQVDSSSTNAIYVGHDRTRNIPSFIDGGMDGELHPYEILYVVSINDAQVTTLSADRASRTSGIQLLQTPHITPMASMSPRLLFPAQR